MSVDRCPTCGYALLHGLCPICDNVTPDLFLTPAHYGAWMRGEPLRSDTARARILEKHRQLIYRRDGYKCVHCGKKENLTIGHRVPIIFGGRNTPGNYQTECGECNRKQFTPTMRTQARSA